MKKLFSLLMVLCMSVTNMTLVQAQEKDSKWANAYQMVDVDVAMPTISDNETSFVNYNLRGSELPSYYNANEEGLVTKIKNQGDLGICWTYAAISTAETSIIKKGLANKNQIDLSEHQVAYFYYHKANDPLGLSNDDHQYIDNENELAYVNVGGNDVLASFLFSQWGGLVDEKIAPTPTKLKDVNPYLDSQLAYNSNAYIMKDAIFLPNTYTTNTSERQNVVRLMKEMILKYGSIASAYSSLVDPNTNTSYELVNKYYYKSGATSVNHAITIVGYDDSIAKEKFYPEKPSQDGAWIVKNSWGNFHGSDEGYFYISYDMPMDVSVAYDYIDKKTYDNNYFYDGTSYSQQRQLTSNDENAKIANVFTAKKNVEYLEAVSVAIASSNTDYSIQVYKNLTDLNDPTSGEAMLAQSVKGSKLCSGIYTIPLNESIELHKGETFSIVVTLNTTNNTRPSYYVSRSDTWGETVFDETTHEQQSFVFDGNKWNDLSNSYHASFCARIKAFTSNQKASGKKISNSNVTLLDDQFYYEGKRIEPVVEVEVDGKVLVEGKDYFIEYYQNDRVGNAKVYINGINEYSGHVIKSFKIERSGKQVDVKTICDNHEAGTMYGSGTYFDDERVEVIAYPNVGYCFDGWYVNNEFVSAESSYSFVTNKDVVIKAVFKKDIPNDTTGLFKVSLNAYPYEGGAVIGAGYVESGKYNNIDAVANQGYVFEGWYIGDKLFSPYNNIGVAVNYDLTISAHFKKIETVDKSDLEILCNDYRDIDALSYDKNSYNVFKNAYNKALAVINDSQATKEDVEKAYKELSKAINNLIVLDYTVLETLYNECVNNLKRDYYTSDSLAKLDEVLVQAKNLLDNKVESQKDIDMMVEALKKAKNNLKEIVHKEELVATISKGEKCDTRGKTNDSIKQLNEAIAYAIKVNEDVEATNAMVNKAIEGVLKAINNLKDVDKTVLNNLIKQAKELNLANQDESTVTNLNNALAKANEVNKNKYASEDEVNEVINELINAISLIKGIDKTALISKINEAKTLDTRGKTNASIKALNKVISIAEGVKNNIDAKQREVDEVLNSLIAAIKALEDVDKRALNNLIKQVKELDLATKEETSVANLKAALNKANEVNNNPYASEDEVSEVFDELNKALKALKDKPYYGYDDVDDQAWYGGMVKEATIRGLMGKDGSVGNNFNPDGKITRGMVATVIYRMAGKPQVTYTDKFVDVKGGFWYSEAIVWASEAKVVSGYANGKFGPDDAIKREDFAIMLRNYAKTCGLNTNTKQSLETFKDYKAVSSYAKDAIAWCVENGLMSGSKKGEEKYLNPGANTTRAEAAKMFVQLSNLIKK